jgi:hypothetical protein
MARIIDSGPGGVVSVYGSVQTNPSAGTVLADSGAVSGGSWWFMVHIYNEINTIQDFEVQHRNSDNSANVAVARINLLSTGQYDFHVRLADNERVRVINNTAPGAGNDMQAVLIGQKLYN